ncbi:hypothetical protein GOP47_0024226 [Adiantum capillus-veneris]|uniref:Uncharacterized protein n=1 Tax=Adiantum capillus-veneris TaxID=13818 RepID=A0A9D4Z6P1_ADICA|nr:hypothetical protein GOP47_0024226 [Adiantum capillus-veneris]
MMSHIATMSILALPSNPCTLSECSFATTKLGRIIHRAFGVPPVIVVIRTLHLATQIHSPICPPYLLLSEWPLRTHIYGCEAFWWFFFFLGGGGGGGGGGDALAKKSCILVDEAPRKTKSTGHVFPNTPSPLCMSIQNIIVQS